MFSGFHDGLDFQLNLVSWYISTYPTKFPWVTISKQLCSLQQHIFIVSQSRSSILAWKVLWTKEPGGVSELDMIEHTHHYSADQESRPLLGSSLQSLIWKLQPRCWPGLQSHFEFQLGKKILFQGHMTVGCITTEAVRQTSVSCSVRSSSHFLVTWLPRQGISWHAQLLQSQLGEPSRKTML